MTALAFEAERWYADKGRRAVAVERLDALGALEIVRVSFDEGEPSYYTLVPEAPDWARIFAEAGGAFLANGHPPTYWIAEPLGRDQSHTSWRVGGMVVKCFRRIEPGLHPEIELGRVVATGLYSHVPQLCATLEWNAEGETYAIAVAHGFVPHDGEGWDWGAERARVGESDWAWQLGIAVRQVHRALAGRLPSRQSSVDERARWLQRAHAQLDLAARVAPDDVAAHADRARRELEPLGDATPTPVSRIHGDLHVGQVLWSGWDPYIVDFEGQPARSLEERRALDTPLRDLASLARSIDHCGRYAVRRRDVDGAHIEEWIAETRRQLLLGYGDHDARLLRALEWERALYEFTYAATYLPQWVYAPRGGLRALLREPEQ